MGEIERADAAIFADPGAEHPKTYEMLEWLLDWKEKNNGIEIIVDKSQNILKDILKKVNKRGKKWITIPAFGESGGMVLRHCTADYKIDVVNHNIRNLQKLKKRQRMKIKTEMWLGITMDEASRMKESQMYNITYKYPLIDLGLRRSDCIRLFKKNDFPIPMKSSCIFCPYHSDKFWKDLKSEGNGVWDLAVEVDEAIRDASKRGLNDKLFLHRTCLPLDQVQFADQQSLWEEECEGYCGL